MLEALVIVWLMIGIIVWAFFCYGVNSDLNRRNNNTNKRYLLFTTYFPVCLLSGPFMVFLLISMVVVYDVGKIEK